MMTGCGRLSLPSSPGLPLSYYTEQVPAPDGWAGHRCGYLVFSEAYAHEADEAHRRGWAVGSLPGEHLHQIVDPAGVAAALTGIARADHPTSHQAGTAAQR
jgi:hypothetical protein